MSRLSADMRSFKNCSSTFLASWASAPVEVPLGIAGAGVACEKVSAGELACSSVGTVPLVVSGFSVWRRWLGPCLQQGASPDELACGGLWVCLLAGPAEDGFPAQKKKPGQVRKKKPGQVQKKEPALLGVRKMVQDETEGETSQEEARAAADMAWAMRSSVAPAEAVTVH